MRHSRSGIFLMELIVCLLFFALSSAVCVKLFAKAQMLKDNSVLQSEACMVAGNVIERYKSQDGLEQSEWYFTDSGVLCEPESADYRVETDVVEQVLKVSVFHDEKEIYTIDYYHHIPEQVGGMAKHEE